MGKSTKGEGADALLALYQGAQSHDVAQFPSFAIRWLGQFIDFDMALFGLLSDDGDGAIVGHYAHLFNEAPPVVDEWLSMVDKDRITREMLRSTGRAFAFHVPLLFKDLPQVVDYALRSRHMNVLGAAVPYSSRKVMAGLSLRRADARWTYSAADRRAMERLLPHVGEAFRINRAIFARVSVAATPAEPLRGICLFDDHGVIVYQDDGFARVASASIVDAGAYRLPAVLRDAFLRQKATRHLLGRFTYCHSRIAGLNVVSVRPTSRLDALTTREFAIANFYGTGLTYKEIGAELTISPSTARRHIEAIYAKLNIRSKTDLSFMVQANASDMSLRKLLEHFGA